MRRLISFFSEPFDGYAPSAPGDGGPEASGAEDPPYFVQLLASLKQRKRPKDEVDPAEAEHN